MVWGIKIVLDSSKRDPSFDRYFFSISGVKKNWKKRCKDKLADYPFGEVSIVKNTDPFSDALKFYA